MPYPRLPPHRGFRCRNPGRSFPAPKTGPQRPICRRSSDGEHHLEIAVPIAMPAHSAGACNPADHIGGDACASFASLRLRRRQESKFRSSLGIRFNHGSFRFYRNDEDSLFTIGVCHRPVLLLSKACNFRRPEPLGETASGRKTGSGKPISRYERLGSCSNLYSWNCGQSSAPADATVTLRSDQRLKASIFRTWIVSSSAFIVPVMRTFFAASSRSMFWSSSL